MTAEDRTVDHSSARGLLQTRVVLRDGLAEIASEEGGPKGGDKGGDEDKEGKGKGKKGKGKDEGGEDEDGTVEGKEGKGKGKGGKGKDEDGTLEGKEGKGKGGKGKDEDGTLEGKKGKGKGKGGKGKDEDGTLEGKEGKGKGGKGKDEDATVEGKEGKGKGKGGKGKDEDGMLEGKEGKGKGGKGKDEDGTVEGKEGKGKGKGGKDKDEDGTVEGKEGKGKGGKGKEEDGTVDKGKGGKGKDEDGTVEGKEGKGKGQGGKGKDEDGTVEGKEGKDKDKEGKGKGKEGKGKGKGKYEDIPTPSPAGSGPSTEPDYCDGRLQMDMDRMVLTNNLGGLGPTAGDPVIHIQKFVDLMDGRTVDLIVSNLTEYSSNNPAINGLNGEFNNVNIKAGFVDLLFTFKDTVTQAPIVMPAFNMTVYDLDGPSKDVYAETVAIDTADFTSYKLTDSAQVIMTTTATKTEFGSSALGEACDNPSSIATVGVVVCKNSGTVDQKDRAVAVQMKGGKSSYHITLRASDAVRSGRNFLFGTPAYFDRLCHSPTQSPTLAPTGAPTAGATPVPTASPTYSPTTSPAGSPSSSPTYSPSSSPTSSPTGSPSYSPSSSPTGSPTSSPSYSPTSSPTGSSSYSPTMSPSSSRSFSPSYSPTSSPTGSPSYSPSSSPTGSPTSSPSYSPTSSPTGSPSYSPTMSPSSSPTLSPSHSPTSSPTGSPSSSPTMSPSSSPTLSPSYSPTSSPTGSPSSSPTSSPTVSRHSPTELPHDVATSFGDPHVSNLKGERFDILQTDYHTFLVIPRGSDEEHALLHVVAKVDPLGQLCSGLLYVTSLRFAGRWVGDVGSLEFTTSVHAAMEAERAMQIKAGASSYLNASQFREVVPQSMAEVTAFQPQEPQSLNEHVDLLLVKLKLGPSIAKVRMVYQKEKVGFSNSLWLTTTGLGHVHDEIGGILGFDDHSFAASKPKKCVEPGEGAASVLSGLPPPHSYVHASASFKDVDG